MSRRPITPEELARKARAELTYIATQLTLAADRFPDHPYQSIDWLGDALGRSADDDDMTRRIGQARADLIAAHVHGMMLSMGITRGQAVGLTMEALGKTRTTIARPLLESERRNRLPQMYPRELARALGESAA